MMKLRASYENDFKQFTQYPSDWQGKRGDVDRYKGHNIAVATSWGLFPETECVYIAQSPGLDATGCFSSTYGTTAARRTAASAPTAWISRKAGTSSCALTNPDKA
jgi:hypothetical protein